MKNENLPIIAKNDFCSLIFQILFSYVGLCNYFKKYTSRIFATYSLAYRPQKFTNYLSEIKFEDPNFAKFSMNLFLVW